ncbi:MAG: NAD(P)/FAD-dependent oxidoreductase [Anaerolineales bacterium]|nr:NAD(P)/FAD-dependent oxidoreductase [Anaerolineales bacterium]MCB8940204.1 NAD(P)/FAD-dependent oxidoreductase [Ardenticatenaceae bacterium]
MRYVIIGNGAAGATAAQTIRQHDATGEIIVLTAEPYPMYSRPGLAYVLINEVPPEQIMARTLDWYEEWGINLVLGEAASLDVQKQLVRLGDGRSLTYDRLLIATGARATPPPYAGAELDGVVYLDTLDGTKELVKKTRRARRAVVIGGGITALELSEGLTHRGIDTHYFLRRDRLWGQVFNDEEAALLEEKMKAHHVHIHYNTEAVEILGDRKGRVRGVKLTDGREFKCDLVGVAIGVKPLIDVVANSPINTDRAILVNERMETSVPNVYAAGDCAQVYDRWTQKHMLDILWPSAVAEGNAAGLNMVGKPYAYEKGSPFNACLLFGLHITTMGQISPRRDDEADEPEILQHVSRGSSEVWYTHPRPYRSAWSAENDSTIRLVLSGDFLVGALVIGEQSLTDSLRYLIEHEVNIGHMYEELSAGGARMRHILMQFWHSILPEPIRV